MFQRAFHANSNMGNWGGDPGRWRRGGAGSGALQFLRPSKVCILRGRKTGHFTSQEEMVIILECMEILNHYVM